MTAAIHRLRLRGRAASAGITILGEGCDRIALAAGVITRGVREI
jgi:hypothetical protein